MGKDRQGKWRGRCTAIDCICSIYTKEDLADKLHCDYCDHPPECTPFLESAQNATSVMAIKWMKKNQMDWVYVVTVAAPQRTWLVVILQLDFFIMLLLYCIYFCVVHYIMYVSCWPWGYSGSVKRVGSPYQSRYPTFIMLLL